MRTKSSQYHLSREEKLQQEPLYLARNVLECAQNDHLKIFAITTSTKQKDLKEDACYKLANALYQEGKKVLLIKAAVSQDDQANDFNHASFDYIYKANLKSEELSQLLTKSRENYDLIFVDIAPVNMYAQSLEYAKLCESLILVERYAFSKYKYFERTLTILKGNNIPVCGVISYK